MILAKYFISFFLCFELCVAQEDFFTNERIKSGLVLPFQVDAVVGEDIFIKITDPVPNQDHCFFHRNGGIDASAPNDK